MRILSPSRKFQAALVATSVVALVLVPVTSASAKSQSSEHQRVVSYWTPSNMASAQSLDYTFDKGSKVGRKVTATPATKAIKRSSIAPALSSATSTGSSWVDGGLALAATGKVFFNVGTSRYVCSGSVAQESDASRSIVLTAGHCIYDNATQAFVTNFLFYPDFDSNPNPDCALTTYGCWTATALVGHYGFTSQTGFTNQATNYDWGFAVMGLGGKNSTQLDATVGAFPLAVPGFTAAGDQAYAFGYPQAAPYAGADLTYCSGAIAEDSGNGNSTWGLTTCTMTGGASGGPLSGFGTDRGSLSSLNSYKYTAAANGMYGPKFNANTTDTFNAALTASANTRVGAPVVVAKPVVAVSITGTLVDKATLTADTSATTGGAVTSWTYQWTRATTSTGSYSNITNATNSTYVLTSSDVGRYLKVRATATNTGGSSTATSAATGIVLGIAPVARVSISGTTTVSSRLTASTLGTTGSTPITYTYQWLRATTSAGTYIAISGATSSTYRLVTADRGQYIKVRLIATNTAGTSTATSSATTIIV
ncbi:MAG: hypothetical protein NTU50_06630 [Actinobacteria bacterium]|nr:hypothetical protein [Actinomycetota bacterium]